MNFSIIKEDQTILLVGIVFTIVAVSIFLEQRYKWASQISACLLCIVGGFVLSNIGLIPHTSPVYDVISNMILLVAIPLMLFKANVKDIIQNSGKLIIVFHIAAVGSFVGMVLVYFLAVKFFPDYTILLPPLVGGHIGGTVNVVALADMYGVKQDMLTAVTVIGNMCNIVLILVLKMLTNSKRMRRYLPHPHIDSFEKEAGGDDIESGRTLAAKFWGSKDIGLKDIAVALATTFVIVGVSQFIANWVLSLNPPEFIANLFGSVYMIMTLITVLLATVFHKFFDSIHGTMELGNICFLLWFCTLGIQGNISLMLEYGAVLLIIFGIDYIVNLIFSFVGAKLTKSSLEDAALASIASIGGPPTAAAMAVSGGWTKMIIPGLLVGLWGYVIGNYCGILFATLLGIHSALL